MSLRLELSGAFVRVADRPRVAKDPDHIRIRLGTLDREVDAEITAHVWMGSKARWDQLTWAIRSFERGIDSPPV